MRKIGFWLEDSRGQYIFFILQKSLLLPCLYKLMYCGFHSILDERQVKGVMKTQTQEIYTHWYLFCCRFVCKPH